MTPIQLNRPSWILNSALVLVSRTGRNHNEREKDVAKVDFLYLSREDVKAVGIGTEEIITLVEGAFRSHGEGKVILPPKTVISFDGEAGGRFNALPAFMYDLNVAGVKWAPGFPNNYKKGLPYQMMISILSDGDTGAPLVIMDSYWLTARRTGAAAAVGAKYLARKESKVLGIIGAGYVSPWVAEAMRMVLPKLELVKITDVRVEQAEAMAQRVRTEMGLHAVVLTSAEAVARGSDVIATVTTNFGERFLKDEWVQPGALVVAVGGPNEITGELTRKVEKIVVDDTAQCIHRGNIGGLVKEGIIGEKNIYAEIEDLVIGRKPGRENETERIICVPIGMGTEDIAVGHRVYQLAKEKGIGQTLTLFDE